LFSEKVQRIKQHHLIRAVTSPEFSEETIDFFLMFIWLYIKQVACCKAQAIHNREKDFIRRIYGTIFYTLNHLDRNASLVRKFLLC